MAATLATELLAEVALRDLQAAIWPVVEQARKSTVAVSAMDSTGSGVVVSADGLILTAGHVVTDLETGEVAEQVTILFDDGEESKARLLGMNRTHDAAMLQLIGEGPWEFSSLGASAELRPGEWVVATGHPSGYDALRPAPVRFGRVISKHIDFFFGSDCVLFGGDSGGPLFDLDGKVVGIHSWIGEDLQTNTHAGISGFLQDWDRLKGGERWGQLMPPPTVREGTPVLGVMFDARAQEVLLDTILLDSAAEQAGLRVGDRVLRVDGKRVSGATFQRYLRGLDAGDEVVLEIQRGREEFISRVQLGQVTALHFVTERGLKILEEQAGEFFQAFGEITDELGNGAVQLFSKGKPVGYGTVWQDGSILAKWSELKAERNVLAVDSDGRQFWLTAVEVFAADDLVVYQAPPEIRLRAIGRREIAAPAGALIAAVRPDGVPEGIGVVSVGDRSLLESARGYLGVALDPDYDSGGAYVEGVTPGSAAAEAGLQKGDVIVAVDERAIDGLQELKTVLSRAGPDQKVVLSVRRPTGEFTLNAVLQEQPFTPVGPSGRERMMNEMDERGLSQRRDRFPSIMQSDISILPGECGLPVVDLDGKFVGMLIARAGRVNTYLLSAERIGEILANRAEE